MEIKAILIEPNKSFKEIDFQVAMKKMNDPEIAIWFHIHAENPTEAIPLLTNEFGFHPVAVEDAVSKDERPELKEFDDHIFLVAPALIGIQNGTQNFSTEIYDEVGFFVKGTTLVTITHVRVSCLESLLNRWIQRQTVNHPEVGYLLFSILDAILDSYFPCLDAIEDRVDEISDLIYEGHTDKLKELLIIKRRMLEMRRRLGPFRDVMNSILRRELPFISDPMAPYFHDLFDNTLRLTELVDTNRDALTGLLDIHLSTVSNNLNEVMKKMTVISTVLMLAALIAGIYGMNFKTMPELEWQYGYLYSLGLMVIVGSITIIIFKRKKWF